MNPEISAFKVEVEGAKNLLAIATIIRKQDRTQDVSDIYRAALVKAVSGYDKFVHELVYRGIWKQPMDVGFRRMLLESFASRFWHPLPLQTVC